VLVRCLSLGWRSSSQVGPPMMCSTAKARVHLGPKCSFAWSSRGVPVLPAPTLPGASVLLRAMLTWGNQLAGSQVLLIREHGSPKFNHYAYIFTQPLFSLSRELWGTTSNNHRKTRVECLEPGTRDSHIM
jgi:hypothetical protein